MLNKRLARPRKTNYVKSRDFMSRRCSDCIEQAACMGVLKPGVASELTTDWIEAIIGCLL